MSCRHPGVFPPLPRRRPCVGHGHRGWAWIAAGRRLRRMTTIFKIRRVGALVIGLMIGLAAPSLAQTTDELNSDGKNPANVVTQSMGLHRQSYSPLKQIDKAT